MAETSGSGPGRGQRVTRRSHRSPDSAELTSLGLTPRQAESPSKLRAPPGPSGAPLRSLRAARRMVLIGRALKGLTNTVASGSWPRPLEPLGRDHPSTDSQSPIRIQLVGQVTVANLPGFRR